MVYQMKNKKCDCNKCSNKKFCLLNPGEDGTCKFFEHESEGI